MKACPGRTRQPIGSFMLLPIAPSPIHPALPNDHGGDTLHELIHHRQSGLLQQHPRRSIEATARSNTVGPQRRGANYLWSRAVRPYHANSDGPTPLAESATANRVQAVPARIQGAPWPGTGLHR